MYVYNVEGERARERAKGGFSPFDLSKPSVTIEGRRVNVVIFNGRLRKLAPQTQVQVVGG